MTPFSKTFGPARIAARALARALARTPMLDRTSTLARTSMLARTSTLALASTLAVATLALTATDLRAQETDSTRLIDEIRNHDRGTAVWWTGHNGWLIKSGDLLIGTDLVLEYNGRIAPSPVSALEIAGELDISFITHGHGDHFGRQTTRILVEHSRCLFVLPESTLDIAREVGIPENRILVARPREAVDVMGIRVEPVRAIHGNARFAVYYEANLQDVGYLITINGIRFLQPGDSVLLEDHLFLDHVDVLFFSPTEHNMHLEPSVILINTLSPDYVLPQHHGTMAYDEANRFWAKGYPAEVKLRLSKPLQERYFILKPGERLEIR